MFELPYGALETITPRSVVQIQHLVNYRRNMPGDMKPHTQTKSVPIADKLNKWRPADLVHIAERGGTGLLYQCV